MLLGAVTYNVLKDWDLAALTEKLPKLGYEAVELRTTHAHGVEPSLPPAEREKVKARFAASKLRLLSFGTTAEFHSPDPAVREKNIADAKAFIDLAHDTSAWGIKVRPNAFPAGTSREQTIAHIGEALRVVGEYGQGRGVEVWVEVHGRETSEPSVCAAIMKATRHSNVGLCWNSNPTDIRNGSVKESFQLLQPWVRNVHINELTSPYPYRELFSLLRQSRYDRYLLCEAQESKEPERFLQYYRALYLALSRA